MGVRLPRSLVDLDRGIGIQLSHPWGRGIMSGFANVLGSEEELGRKVCDFDRCGVVERQTLYTSQGDILGDFDAKTLETNNKNIGSSHAFHSLVAKNVELSTVKGFIDLVSTDIRFVYLHHGRRIDFWRLCGL